MNLLHLPGEPAGVVRQVTAPYLALNLVHPPDKLAGVALTQ